MAGVASQRVVASNQWSQCQKGSHGQAAANCIGGRQRSKYGAVQRNRASMRAAELWHGSRNNKNRQCQLAEPTTLANAVSFCEPNQQNSRANGAYGNNPFN